MADLVPIDAAAPSVIDRHHLAQITEKDAALFTLLEDATLTANEKLQKLLTDAFPLNALEGSLVTSRMVRSLRTMYELLEAKGRIHEQKTGPGVIRARAAVRTKDGDELAVEVTMPGDAR
jgi:hypothetical protein